MLLISLLISKANFDNSFYYYRLAIIFTILSEFNFTLYKDVYGLFNLIAHILKYISFIFIYRYVMINIMEDNLLFINIKDSGNGIDILTYNDLLDGFNIDEYNFSKIHDVVGVVLTIINKLVKILNGNIEIKSKIAEGAEFSIVLNLDKLKYANFNI